MVETKIQGLLVCMKGKKVVFQRTIVYKVVQRADIVTLNDSRTSRGEHRVGQNPGLNRREGWFII